MLTPFFSDRPVKNFDDARACESDRYGALFRHLLDQGVYVAPSQFEALFVSTAHDDEELERTIEAAKSFSDNGGGDH
jgi:glutamate-1-semialdehyde 2,1-aminomutase